MGQLCMSLPWCGQGDGPAVGSTPTPHLAGRHLPSTRQRQCLAGEPALGTSWHHPALVSAHPWLVPCVTHITCRAGLGPARWGREVPQAIQTGLTTQLIFRHLSKSPSEFRSQHPVSCQPWNRPASSSLCRARLCPALPGSVLPSPAPSCPALPCPAWLCPALPCPVAGSPSPYQRG